MDLMIEQLETALFEGIGQGNLGAMLSCTGYHIAQYKKGQVIALEEERIRHVGIVLSGAVDMVKEDVWGNRTLLMRTGKSDLFGETFACTEDNRSLVTFVACEDSAILFIPFHKIMHTCSMACEFHHRLIENMVRIIATKNLELMRKVEVVT
jgi:CRP-like cAMP-binding protein